MAVGGVVQAGDPVFKVSEYLDGHCQEKPHDELQGPDIDDRDLGGLFDRDPLGYRDVLFTGVRSLTG